MEIESEKIAAERRKAAKQLAIAEGSEKFNERVKSTLENREKEVSKIVEYQKKTGIPTREEMDNQFFEEGQE